MYTRTDKKQKNKSQSVANTFSQKQRGDESAFQLVDNRTEVVAQRKLQEVANNSPQVSQIKAIQEMANNSPQAKQAAQLKAMVNSRSVPSVQEKKKNGIAQLSNGSFAPPTRDKAGEIASAMGQQYGVDTSPINFTHNSSFPNSVGAVATIQGKDIHFGPGQDSTENIKHEVGHFIDNTQNGIPKGDAMVNGQAVNTTREQAADQMAKAPLQRKISSGEDKESSIAKAANPAISSGTPIQRSMSDEEKTEISTNLSKPRSKNIIDDTAKTCDTAGTLEIMKAMKEGRDTDTNNRLITLGFGSEIQSNGNWEGATWDFKHWMVDGEMPPDYGYGFKVRNYYSYLTESDKKEFSEYCKNMRSATTITRILTTFELDKLAQLGPEQIEAYNHTRGILADTREGKNVGFLAFASLLKLPLELEKLADSLVFFIRNRDKDEVRKLELNFTHIGDEIWKTLARWKPNTALDPRLRAFGEQVMLCCERVDGKISDLDGNQKIDVNRIFGKIVRAWGDATASLGFDPYCRMITHTQSSTTDDYLRGENENGKHSGQGGRQMELQKQFVEKDPDHISWCDMTASNSMWNQAANYDRYRDTIVTLYVQPDHGANLGRHDPNMPELRTLRVTAAELQLGVLNSIFSGYDDSQGPESRKDLTKPIYENGPVDARNQRSEVRGGKKGLPDQTYNLADSSGHNNILRHLGWARLQGDGKMSFLVRTEGDLKWYKAEYHGDQLIIPELKSAGISASTN
jgi:hypothetical protein